MQRLETPILIEPLQKVISGRLTPSYHATDLYIQARSFEPTDFAYLYSESTRRCSEDSVTQTCHFRFRGAPFTSLPLFIQPLILWRHRGRIYNYVDNSRVWSVILPKKLKFLPRLVIEATQQFQLPRDLCLPSHN